jgi:DNA (cytosine-5)-methyltransferase 1
MLNGLDLFSGIGGLTLALSPWVRPVAYCEIEPYAQAVLLSRMSEGNLPTAPIWDDIKTLTADVLPEAIDIIYGGSPCQDFSESGSGEGLEGERSSLFYEFIRVVREIKPTFVFWENVRGAQRAIRQVTMEFKKLGYAPRGGELSAAHLGRDHIRKRIWILAHSHCQQVGGYSMQRSDNPNPKERGQEAGRDTPTSDANWRERSNRRFREAYGYAYGVERVECIGNGVDVVQAREAFKRLMGI